jgi:hypothetical protein
MAALHPTFKRNHERSTKFRPKPNSEASFNYEHAFDIQASHPLERARPEHDGNGDLCAIERMCDGVHRAICAAAK